MKLKTITKEEWKEKRRANALELDQFFTLPEKAKECWDFFLGYLKEEELSLDKVFFIEPSAGEGSFFSLLPEGSLGVEKDPSLNRGKYITGDFLSLTVESLIEKVNKSKEKIVVIGNPPFGKNSSGAVNFFNRSALIGDFIAMILPLTFNKISVQSRLDSRFHLERSLQLDSQSFIFLGAPYRVNCVFQIWKRKEKKREMPILPKSHPDWEFVEGFIDGTVFAIQRVGARAGQILHRNSGKTSRNYYYIKPIAPNVLEKFKGLDLENSREKQTSSYPSLSKTELVSIYSEHNP